MKIIQINGFKGMLTVLFIGICLFAGFVVFPGLVAMTLWNKYLVSIFNFPILNIFQGVLLWGIITVSYFILTGKEGFAVSYKNTPMELSDNELNMILRNAKIYSQMRNINRIMQKSDKFEITKEQNIRSFTNSLDNQQKNDDSVSGINKNKGV